MRLFVLVRIVVVVASIAFAVGTAGGPATASSLVTGTVIDSRGKPIPNATIKLAGANRTLQTASSTTGSFAFANVTDGEYDLTATSAAGSARRHLEVSSAAVDVVLRISPQTLGRVVSVSSSNALRSGGSTLISGAQLAHSPAGNSMSNVFAQLPSAARGSNGQIHINGDHGDINYSLDGVPLPQALNRVIGSEVDPSDVGFLDVIEGAYPAKYGNKFGAVVNIATVAGTGLPGGGFESTFGSRGDQELSLQQRGPMGTGGGFTLALREAHVAWGLDPPVPNYNHDQGSVASQFLRVTLPAGKTDNINLDVSHGYQTFQIPPDTSNGTPATADDVETQTDTFAALAFHHVIGDSGSLVANAFGKISRIRDFSDLAADFVASPGDNCSGTDPNVARNCLFAAFSDRLARSIGGDISYANTIKKHTLEAGIDYDAAQIQKLYDILLQPDNYLNPGSPLPTRIVDDAPNVAHSVGLYLQDGWQLSPAYRLDYGMRYDTFTIFSKEFRNGYTQASPRIKLTRLIGDHRASVYAYFGRLFTPFSFENVSPAAAAQINPASGLSFDLRPSRESLYEVGGTFQLGRNAHGSWKVAHKSLVDVIDDAQVGSTNIHQDVNFGDGRADFQDVIVEFPHGNGTHDYISLTHSRAVNRGCGSQLLSGCDQPPYDWFDADHDQRWDGSFGKEFSFKNSDWVTLIGEYGSGLSTGSACDTCKVPPHFVLDGSWGHEAGNHLTLTLTLRNILNDRYAITRDSALQGTHWAEPFSIDVSLKAHY